MDSVSRKVRSPWRTERCVVVEIKSGTLARVSPDGTVTRVADHRRRPERRRDRAGRQGVRLQQRRLRVGIELDGMTSPAAAADGLHRRAHPARRHRHRRGRGPLHRVRRRPRCAGPNDIVFDDHGGFYFTDLGKSRARDVDKAGVYYATADGSSITRRRLRARPRQRHRAVARRQARCTWPRR